MQERQVRLSPAGVAARLNDSVGQLVNISLSGALVRVDQMMEVGHRVNVVFTRDAINVRLSAGVVRTQRRDGIPGWHVGVQFFDAPADRKRVIPQLLTAPEARGGRSPYLT